MKAEIIKSLENIQDEIEELKQIILAIDDFEKD